MNYIKIIGEVGSLVYLQDGRFAETVTPLTMDGESYCDYDKTIVERDYWKLLCEAYENDYVEDVNLSFKVFSDVFSINNPILEQTTSPNRIIDIIRQYLNGQSDPRDMYIYRDE